jgi:predicted nucleotidyltransferase component of viral defense system
LILKKEIEKVSLQKGVAKSIIDKDWVLGHFIDAIYSVPECRQDLMFKGGTCLRKCRFPDYRFSEDLDFTSGNPDFDLSRALLSRIVKIVTNRTEIPLFIKELKELKSDDKRTGFAAIVKFWGADHPKNQSPPPPARWTSSIKIEIILYEKILFEPDYLEVIHEYSDSLSEAAKAIPCYPITEVLAEKLRALVQRSYSAPRDFYDIWYLSNHGTELNWNEIVAAFYQKMKLKGLEFTGVDQMINPENDKRLKAAWQNSLVHQVKSEFLPEYEPVRDEIKGLLDELFGSVPN